ncbi:hypothetical protein [Christiangramia sabulilitoris]|uniref:hypothetical protein n=1 Tax=Christiangramia sabulilitoris TaxID=2583991 RepID=UPI00140CF7CE|nr:hypothetical protein [Christiangramia sabulilitoris]
MGALVNLVIGFIMGLLSANQIEEPKTAQYEFQKESLEIFQSLEKKQQRLES